MLSLRTVLVSLYAFSISHQTAALNYNETFSYELFKFASAAYQTDPSKCFTSNTQLVEIFHEKCDIVGQQCFAFTALSHAQKAIILSYRGTMNDVQLLVEILETVTIFKHSYPAGGSIEHYFYNAFRVLYAAIDNTNLLHKTYPDYHLWVTGHSLGGALASIASIELVYEYKVPKENVSLVTFGQPRVGSYYFAKAHNFYVPNSWRVVHKADIVPHVPPCLEFPGLVGCIGYTFMPYHHGTEVWYKNNMTLGKKEFKECYGKPINEDKGCSNSEIVLSVAEHKWYFGVFLKTFCDPNA